MPMSAGTWPSSAFRHVASSMPTPTALEPPFPCRQVYGHGPPDRRLPSRTRAQYSQTVVNELWIAADALGGLKPVVFAPLAGRAMTGRRRAQRGDCHLARRRQSVDMRWTRKFRGSTADVLQGQGISENFMAVWGQKPGTGHVCDALFVTDSVMSPGLVTPLCSETTCLVIPSTTR